MPMVELLLIIIMDICISILIMEVVEEVAGSEPSHQTNRMQWSLDSVEPLVVLLHPPLSVKQGHYASLESSVVDTGCG